MCCRADLGFGLGLCFETIHSDSSLLPSRTLFAWSSQYHTANIFRLKISHAARLRIQPDITRKLSPQHPMTSCRLRCLPCLIVHIPRQHLAGRRRCLTTSASSTSTPSPSSTTSPTSSSLVQVGRRGNARVALRPESRVVVDHAVHGISVVDGVVSTPVTASASTSTTRLEAVLLTVRRRAVGLLLSEAATAARSEVAARSTAILLGASESSTVGAAQRGGLVGWAKLLAWRTVAVGGV